MRSVETAVLEAALAGDKMQISVSLFATCNNVFSTLLLLADTMRYETQRSILHGITRLPIVCSSYLDQNLQRRRRDLAKGRLETLSVDMHDFPQRLSVYIYVHIQSVSLSTDLSIETGSRP